MIISLCIATFHRPQRLAALLRDLTLQQRKPDEVIVVDNDAAGSARAVVEQRRRLGAPFPIHYAIQPEQNIALTRNHGVALANGDWIAFIDDDERAPAAWLKQLVDTAQRYDADGVLGPVEPVLPLQAPGWIRRGHFYDWARLRTGSVIPANQLRFGNVLLRARWLRDEAMPFDPAYGLTGGEDGDLLTRLAQRGAGLVWCDEAVVREPVEASRLSLRWLLLRSLRGGQDFARHRIHGRYGAIGPAGRAGFFLRSLAQATAAAAMAPISLLAGLHRGAFWLLKVAANVGKMSVFMGCQYREYAVAAGAAGPPVAPVVNRPPGAGAA